jgi:nucleotide-binding universal stress UspA family protein
LVVRERVHGPYRRIVVTTDFSASSARALQTTVRLFPHREYVLYHAFQPPLSGLVSKENYAGMASAIERGECAQFLASIDLPEQARARLHTVIEHGALATMLTNYVRQNDIELVALGTHGRSGLMNIVFGNTAARMLDWLPCDTLIVREPQ